MCDLSQLHGQQPHPHRFQASFSLELTTDRLSNLWNLLLISFLWALLFRWKNLLGATLIHSEVLQRVSWWVFVLSLSWDWVFISISTSLCDFKHFSVFLVLLENEKQFCFQSCKFWNLWSHSSFFHSCLQAGQFLLETDLAKEATNSC